MISGIGAGQVHEPIISSSRMNDAERMMDTRQKDTEKTWKGFPLAKSRII